jgi:hypothetical protein
MHLQIQIAGVLLIILALLHIAFPKYFNWRQEFGSLSLINRQMFYVHVFFIAFGVFLMGLLCLTSTQELLNTDLGKRICLGMGIFWIVRLVIQFFVCSSELWKGKRFESVVHVLLSALWIYTGAVFLLSYYM